jgi:hypothetical protein
MQKDSMAFTERITAKTSKSRNTFTQDINLRQIKDEGAMHV